MTTTRQQMTSDIRLNRIAEIENTFLQNPIPLDHRNVYVGIGACADGELYDVVVANAYEECLNLVMSMASNADGKTLDVTELKLRLLEMASQNGRYGSVKGSLVSCVLLNTNNVGNKTCSYSICYRKTKDIN